MQSYQIRRAAVVCALVLLIVLTVAHRPVARSAGPISVCASGCDYTSIQAAVDAAPPDTTIAIGTGTYSETVTISKTLTLQGTDALTTIIDGTMAGRVVSIRNRSTVMLTDLTLTNGNGGIYNEFGCTLTLNRCRIIDNADTTGTGGGILNDIGTTLTLNDTLVRGNRTTINGGGISGVGELTLNNSVIISNTADLKGGGISHGTTSYSTLTVNNSTISDNQAAYGGGISNEEFGTARITRSTIANNTASVHGGGIFNNGLLTLTNSTLSSNSAGMGGGIRNDATGNLILANTTVTSNTVTEGGGGIDNYSGKAVLKNSIVATQRTGADCATIAGNISSYGHNLDSDDTCELMAAGDIPGADPMLGPLQDNGGATLTHALLVGSPAIDSGDDIGCPNVDQRGFPRPLNGDQDGTAACDIGAYEYGFYYVYLPLILN